MNKSFIDKIFCLLSDVQPEQDKISCLISLVSALSPCGTSRWFCEEHEQHCVAEKGLLLDNNNISKINEVDDW